MPGKSFERKHRTGHARASSEIFRKPHGADWLGQSGHKALFVPVANSQEFMSFGQRIVVPDKSSAAASKFAAQFLFEVESC